MTATARSACGASLYTPKDYSMNESGLNMSNPCPPTQTWTELIDALLDIRNLADDWDGQGSRAPHPALVDWAITLAQHFQASGTAPADFAIAGVNGTVIFEWHRPDEYLEIEVTAPEKAEGRSVRMGTEATEVFTVSRRS